MNKTFTIILVCISLNITGQVQPQHNFSGNTQLNYQTFQEDLTIDAEQRNPYISGYTNLLYNYKNFTIGTRIEAYNNTIPGLYDYEGYGIASKFFQFQNKIIDVIKT